MNWNWTNINMPKSWNQADISGWNIASDNLKDKPRKSRMDPILAFVKCIVAWVPFGLRISAK